LVESTRIFKPKTLSNQPSVNSSKIRDFAVTDRHFSGWSGLNFLPSGWPRNNDLIS